MDVEKAFTQAYEEHSDGLFRHCSFRVSNRERALELTQETFMKTWDAASNGKEIQNYKAFLFRVLNNLIIDEYRKKKSSSLDALLEQEGVTEGNFEGLQTGSLEEEIEKLEIGLQSQELARALTQLPDSYRSVVVMRFMDGLQPKEIAEVLNENENTVSVRINRGIKKLQEYMVTQ
ncbi:RNA polymerase sigma factor [Candidatus Kaiserbacteria bacterium]|nr:MAG: RNA polymerase sigma factor [Candidatus Kaiserbacteria bacterium]